LEAARSFHRLGEEREAEEEARKARHLFETAHDIEGLVDYEVLLGPILMRGSGWKEADQILEHAQNECWSIGYTPQMLPILANRGVLKLWRGDLEDAELLLRRAWERATKLGDKRRIAIACLNLFLLYTRKGSFAGRRELLRRAANYREKARAATKEISAEHRANGLLLEYEAEFLLTRGDLQGARHHASEAITFAEAIDDREIADEARCRLAEVEIAEGNPMAAKALALIALQGFEHDPHQEAVTKRILGHALLLLGNRGEGKRLLREARSTLKGIGETLERQRVTQLLNASPHQLPSIADLHALPATRPDSTSVGSRDSQRSAMSRIERPQKDKDPFQSVLLPGLAASTLTLPAASTPMSALDQINELLRQVHIDYLLPALQASLARLEGQDPGGLEESKAFAKKVRWLLDRLDLRLKCPYCSQPSLLAVTKGTTVTGAFVFQHTAPGTKRTHHGGRTTLPHLQLIENSSAAVSAQPLNEDAGAPPATHERRKRS
jgi:tetratricopeptide (TPR) repeat protein